ncbi:ATP-dependent RNA helicase [Hortaea werneckii]|nr:ATP-dependent RNA helicase [Hortaea werneckii]
MLISSTCRPTFCRFSRHSLTPFLLDFSTISVKGRDFDHGGFVVGLDIFELSFLNSFSLLLPRRFYLLQACDEVGESGRGVIVTLYHNQYAVLQTRAKCENFRIIIINSALQMHVCRHRVVPSTLSRASRSSGQAVSNRGFPPSTMFVFAPKSGCNKVARELVISQSRRTSNVHWHLLDLSAVELLNLTHHAHIVGSDEVDSDTLPTETATTTDTVDVVLPVGRKVVVDDQRNLLHVDTTGKQVSGDQDTGRARAELLHDHVTLALVHVTVHGRHGEVTGSELVVSYKSESVSSFHSSFSTAMFAHELGGDLKDILRHGSREQDDLGGLWQELEDVVDLLSETARQHLVSLVEDEHLHAVGLQHAALDHVVDTARSANNDLRAVLQRLHVVPHAGATNAGVALDVHEVANSHDDLLDLLSQLTGRGKDQTLASLDVRVELLEGGDRESSGLAGTGLSLSDHIVALDDGHDRTLLNRGWALETVSVNAAEQLAPEVHRVEGIGGLIVVRLDLSRLWMPLPMSSSPLSAMFAVLGSVLTRAARTRYLTLLLESRLVLVCENVRLSSASSWEWRLTP